MARTFPAWMVRGGAAVATAAAVVAVMGGARPSAQAPAAKAVPTFTKDIAPIFQNKCEVCHRPEQHGADVAHLV